MGSAMPRFLRSFSLEGKTALITGGSGGIGLGVCSALAGSGAGVISLQLLSEPTKGVKDAVKRANKRCYIYNCDPLFDLESIPPVIEEVIAKHNPSIVIN